MQISLGHLRAHVSQLPSSKALVRPGDHAFLHIDPDKASQLYQSSGIDDQLSLFSALLLGNKIFEALHLADGHIVISESNISLTTIRPHELAGRLPTRFIRIEVNSSISYCFSNLTENLMQDPVGVILVRSMASLMLAFYLHETISITVPMALESNEYVLKHNNVCALQMLPCLLFF
jgi:hypothetical protein